MDLWPILQSLVFLTFANGTPVIAKRLFGSYLAFPLDAGVHFVDGRPLLGPSKTVRGVVLSVAITAAAAPVLGVSVATGALLACLAMLGDMILHQASPLIALQRPGGWAGPDSGVALAAGGPSECAVADVARYHHLCRHFSGRGADDLPGAVQAAHS